jgi:hypothetical protein
MSNSNSVAGFATSGTIRNTFPTQAVATTTETALTVNTDTGTAVYNLGLPYGSTAVGAQAPVDVNSNSAVIRRSGRDYGVPSGVGNSQFSTSSWDGYPFKVRMAGIGNAAAQLATPVNGTFTTATTGGTLLDLTTYYYRVAAVNASGGTSLASTETSLETGNSTGNTNTLTVKWAAVTGATTYKVYGRSTGAELLMATVTAPTLQWVDDGSVTPSGALPTSATSDVTLNLYQGTSTTLSGDHAIGTTGAVAIATAGGAFNFLIEATLLWDATSQTLSGGYTANIGYGSSSHFVGPTVVTNVVGSLPIASVAFLGSVTFGFASSANSVTLREFTIDKT